MKTNFLFRRRLNMVIAAWFVFAGTHEVFAVAPRRLLSCDVPVSCRCAPRGYKMYRHYLNRRHPRYYGGFHARYFQDLGMSPGDIGLRGNGIYSTPW